MLLLSSGSKSSFRLSTVTRTAEFYNSVYRIRIEKDIQFPPSRSCRSCEVVFGFAEAISKNRSSGMSSEDEEYEWQQWDFDPTCTPDHASNAPSNPGPSELPRTHSHGESGLNTYRQMIQSMEQQVQDLRDRNAFLKTLVHRNLYDEPKPEVARWELVKPHMGAIARQLLLGLDPKKNGPFPREKHIKEAILEAFDVPPTDTRTRKVFDRAWVETLRKKAKLCISNMRGRFSTTARTQLWHYLGVPKLQQGTQEETEAWKQTLELLAEDNCWRWSEDDPFGSDAFCNTISYVKFGKRLFEDQPLRLTAKQFAWFVFVMQLAMDGDRNMKESEMRCHREAMKGLEEYILENCHLLKKIEVVVDG